MSNTILGKKLGMTQIFDQVGNAIPVTLIQAGPCTVLQVKSAEKDGYNAIQLGFDDKKEKKTNKPTMGHFVKYGSNPKRYIRETRVTDPEIYEPGQVITAGRFKIGDFIDITGTSKGKGFAGVMKRHGFSGFKATHGTHESKRGGGSLGPSADPARVFRGKKMPGHMGNETVTVQNLTVVDVREAQNLIAVMGPVPGAKNGLLIINFAKKKPIPDRPIQMEEPEAVESQEPDDTPVTAEDTQPVEENTQVEEKAQVEEQVQEDEQIHTDKVFSEEDQAPEADQDTSGEEDEEEILEKEPKSE
jgi:large subunit ribosomal protein L3